MPLIVRHRPPSAVASSYGDLLAGMLVMTAGMGLTMAPATESIMGSLPPAQARVGSAVNDTTRELGAALGVAVLGSLLASGYASTPAERPRRAEQSPGPGSCEKRSTSSWWPTCCAVRCSPPSWSRGRTSTPIFPLGSSTPSSEACLPTP